MTAVGYDIRASLACDGICFGYRRQQVLRDITMALRPGAVTVLLGPNGSGKSTLLALLAGLRAPERGTVRLEGQALQDVAPRERARRIALVPQQPRVAFPFTVREIVTMGRHPHRTRWQGVCAGDRQIVTEALERMELQELADAPATELSGGERQRCVIARALAQQTPVLLLDEPTGSLDIRHALALLEHLRDLARAGRCVALAIHDLTLAGLFADEAVLLSQGQVFSSGAAKDVLTERRIAEVFGVGCCVAQEQDGLGIRWRAAEQG